MAEKTKNVRIDVEVKYRVQLTFNELDSDLVEDLESQVYKPLSMCHNHTKEESDLYEFIQSNFTQEDCYDYEIEVQSIEK